LSALAAAAGGRYTTVMFIHTPTPHRRGKARLLTACIALVCLCGCASLRFKPLRETRFINMDAEVLHVEYGEEKRTETFPNGLTSTFTGKVRLRLPDGKRVILYQTMSSSGIRFVTKNRELEFIEKGFYCLLRHNGKTVFEGVYCRE
ncbi:MAG: hypothetical protein PHV28_05095, partial [Kiritimatiellae bacterium]|nr:hypothetical protein [Kiritimatiellia bacterium]